jgi:nucleoside-diphosphate-sugar epimerase
MRIFVTGATGFVGSAVVRELRDAGHRVLGLARSDAAAALLAAEGADVHRGDLDDLDSLRRGAAAADGVIHTAFNHDFSKFRDTCEADRRVIAALADALAGSERPLVVTSGLGILPQGVTATEDTAPASGTSAHPRKASEDAANAAACGARTMIVRLPPSVHGAGDHGFVPILIRIARETGVSGYLGEGLNRWPAVHRVDVARVFRLAVEAGEAGARFHAVAETGIPFRDIAALIGNRLGVPVKNVASDHFGWFASFAAMDVPATATRTQERLGWRPEQPGLLDDLDHAGYFGI